MPDHYFIRTRISKKGNTVWELVDKHGKVIAADIHREKILTIVYKKIRLMEHWPSSPREIDTENNKKVKHVISQKKPWQSVNFAIVKWQGLLQTADVAKRLGVSESWVRKNLMYSEWHHAYKEKGDYGKAFFYDPEDVIIQLAEDEEKTNRFLKMSYKYYSELCQLVNKPADIDNLGWYKKVKKYQISTKIK
jgi:hypothetical protein